MGDLRISTTLALPLDAATSTIVVYGGKGMGKTNLATVLVEEFAHAGVRFAVIDPMGVWWGLRHSADGKGQGIKVLILGGIHGDLPITPESGALVADLVVDEDASVIIDISRRSDGSMWAIAERVRFVRDYAKRVYQRQGEKRRPLNLVVDEAARFAPQIVRQGESDVAACMGAIAVLVEEGRNVGIGVTLVTQRSARLNKDVAELADCMIAFRIVGPNSMRAVLDWLGEYVERPRLKEISEKLRSLPRGSALVVSPGWLEFEGIVAMRRRTTFDSSATPKPGDHVRVSGDGAKVDLAKYRDRLSDLVEQQKANDPRALRARIAELEKQAGKASVTPIDRVVEIERVVEVPALKGAQLADLRALVNDAHTAIDKARSVADDLGVVLKDIEATIALAGQLAPSPSDNPAIAAVKDGMRAVHRSGSNGVHYVDAMDNNVGKLVGRKTVNAGPGDPALGSGERKILTALAQYRDGRTKQQVAILTGYAHTGGGFSNYISGLRSRGYLEGEPGCLRITAAGLKALGSYQPLPSGRALFEHWLGQLGKAEREILRALYEDWPTARPKEYVAVKAGYAADGGGFNNALSRLRTLELIEGKAKLKASDQLQDGSS